MRPFRLQSVARLRQMEEDRAAAELVRRRELRRTAEARSTRAAAALGGSTLPSASDVLTWRAAVAARAAASAATVEAASAVELARADESGAQGEYSVARRRTTTIGKLADRHHAAELAEENHTEQLLLDEIASQRARTQHEGVR